MPDQAPPPPPNPDPRLAAIATSLSAALEALNGVLQFDIPASAAGGAHGAQAKRGGKPSPEADRSKADRSEADQAKTNRPDPRSQADGPNPARPKPDWPEPDRPEPARPQAKRPEPGRPEPSRPQPNRPEPNRAEANRPQADRPASKRPDPDRPEPASPHAKRPKPAHRDGEFRAYRVPPQALEKEREFLRLSGAENSLDHLGRTLDRLYLLASLMQHIAISEKTPEDFVMRLGELLQEALGPLDELFGFLDELEPLGGK